MIPFPVNTETWAVIASMQLPKEEIVDEANFALNTGEIFFAEF